LGNILNSYLKVTKSPGYLVTEVVQSN